MNFIATNLVLRQCFRAVSYLAYAGMVAMPAWLISDLGMENFLDGWVTWCTVCLFWQAIPLAVAYFLRASPVVRFTDEHVVVEGRKGDETIAWADITGAHMIMQSGVSSWNPVRLKVKGRVRGLTFQANEQAKAHLRTRFGELGWGL